MAAPDLKTIAPAGGAAGISLTLTGTGFGAAAPASRVMFRSPSAALAAPAVKEWADQRIVATVPPLAGFGSGGPLEVTVETKDGTSAALAFVLHEASAPDAQKIDPVAGLEDTTVTVTGQRFGRGFSTPGFALLFASGGATPVEADTIKDWGPTTIKAAVPKFAKLGPAGPKSVRVRTPWGDSQPLQFDLAQAPKIASIAPPSASPRVGILIHGEGFGERATGAVHMVDAPPPDAAEQPDVPLPVTDWKPDLIIAQVPALADLHTTGEKRIRVTTRWAAHELRFEVTTLGSITGWTRIEPHARADDLNLGLETGLQAAVYDPLWLLGRQWQMRELDGEDAGSPIVAKLEAETAPIARWRPGDPAGATADVPPGQVPLEALVEHEQVLPRRDRETGFDDYRLAVEGGQQWLRILAARLPRRQDIDRYRREYLKARPLRPPTRDERAKLSAATLRFIDLAAGRVPDGARLYVELQMALPENGGIIPTAPEIAENDRTAFRRAVVDWFAWWDATFSLGTSGGQTWDSAQMEYRFAVSAETSTGEVTLAAPAYDGRRLDWYSLSVGGTPSLRARPETPSAPAAAPVKRALVPAPVSYPGMPAPRYWELEDARVDFGAVGAGPTDLLRLLYVEFATVYGNDWFGFPVDRLPVGSLLRIDSLKVFDTFGRETPVQPLTESLAGFRMFDMGGRPDLLLVADALPSTFESAPLEEVLLLRDELANLVWGVERIVSRLAGSPVDRAEVWLSRDRTPPPAGDGPPLAYRLSTTVPDYWIPFVLKLERDRAVVRARWLERASLRDPVTGQLIGPEGELLRHDAPTVRVHDHVVGHDGVRLLREWQYGRGPDGRTHLWRTRRRDPGRGEGSSGLRFDVVDRRS